MNFKNVPNDRRVVLYLNACDCGGKYCLENAAYLVKNHLRKVILKDVALEFLIEYVFSYFLPVKIYCSMVFWVIFFA